MLALPLDPPFDTLTDLVGSIDRLQAEDIRLEATSALGPRLKTLRGAINRLEAEVARTVEVFDRTNTYEADGSLSAASWLRHRCNLSYSTASNQVQFARRLPELPQARAAFASGEISSAHVSLIARAADQVGIEPVREQEEVLVEAARQLDPRMFRQVTVHLRNCVDPDGALKDANDAHERRGVWLSETMDGVFVLNGTLDPEGGAILRAALAAVEGKPVAGDQRTARQRRADAMVDLGRHRLDVGDLPTTGCQRPHLIITADLESLAGKPAGAGLLNWEQLVPAETVRRLACDCSVTPMVVGSDGEPLSVGRARRTVPAPMRRAIMRRDKHCRFPGCDRPVAWTDGHHLRHWIDGGPTAYWNVWLLCRRHHRRVHEEGWRLERAPDGGLIAIPP
jgi:Domain of unknown function (DUF222)